jgi:hypothetical protein
MCLFQHQNKTSCTETVERRQTIWTAWGGLASVRALQRPSIVHQRFAPLGQVRWISATVAGNHLQGVLDEGTSRSPVGSVDPWRIREDRIVHAKEPFKIPGNSIKISECSSSYGVGVTVRKPFHTALTCLNYSLKQSTSSLPNVM